MTTLEQQIIEVAPIAMFDYGALDVETRIVVQQRTSEIKERIQRSAQGIIEIGARLGEVRARLDFGSFDGWLKTEFDWSRRMAYNFIGVHEQFGRANFAQLDVAASALYLLAAPSTPPEARQEALDLAATGKKVTHQTAQQLIAAHKPEKPKEEDDGAPHLPRDFVAAQARAKKLGIHLSMNASGSFALIYESGARAVAGTATTWSYLLDQLGTLERERLAPPPTQTALPGVAGDEEIAAPTPSPVLTPLPPMLTPLTPALMAASGEQALIQSAARLLYCRKLVALAQREWDDLARPHLERNIVPVVVLDEAQAEAAARMALNSPAMRAQAGMLTFGATVTMQAWDDDSGEVGPDEEEIAE